MPIGVGETRSVDELRAFRENVAETYLDQESLLMVPIIRAVFANTDFRLVERHVDARWHYQKFYPSLAGFNPSQYTYYYSNNSYFSSWLRDPSQSARRLNVGDRLVFEVLFMVHDYLHAWAYQIMDSLWPNLHLLDGPITKSNLEDFAFCHLLSETAATVGLDYWYLSHKNLNEVCAIGTLFGPLATSYRENYVCEFQRFCPDFSVQRPEFFARIARLYCTGLIPGFRAEAIQQSPTVSNWLKQELEYGREGRIITREWLAYMSDVDIGLDPEDLTKPITVDDPNRGHLIRELGERLWESLRDPVSGFSPTGRVRTAPGRRRRVKAEAIDFRYTNCAALPRFRKVPSQYKRNSINQLVSQLISQVPFHLFPHEHHRHIKLAQRESDMDLFFLILNDLPFLPQSVSEPEDLILQI